MGASGRFSPSVEGRPRSPLKGALRKNLPPSEGEYKPEFLFLVGLLGTSDGIYCFQI